MKQTSAYVNSNFSANTNYPQVTAKKDTTAERIISTGSKVGDIFDAVDRALNPDKYTPQPIQPAQPQPQQKSGIGWVSGMFLVAAGVTAVYAGKSFYDEKIKDKD